MPEAVATREANGMETIYRDVWDGLQLTAEQHRAAYGSYGLLIASPPCQTFSLAGKGAGRAALDEVLEAIELHAYKDADALLRFGQQHDMRTALVLTPLAYVWRDRPRIVALEQVPTVLPVWEACADVMREWGYEVKVEVLNAEQYGVPQTRKRAILVARRGGPVSMPTPTHSRYYSRTPDKLDPGVLKWVSMAEALGWGAKDQPSHTITGGVHGPTDRWASGGNSVRKALDAKIGGPDWIDKPNQDTDARTTYGQRFDVADVAALQSYPTAVRTSMGKPKVDDRNGSHELDPFNRPAHTLTSKSESWLIKAGGADWSDASRLTAEQAAALQSYPTALRSPYGTNGDRNRRGERAIGQPAPTLTSKADRNKWDGEQMLTLDQATTLQTYPTHLAASGTTCQVVDPRPATAPAPTITGAGNAEWGTRPTRAAGPGDRDPKGRRVEPDEAATLQTYEPPFVFCGTKTKQFLQIGNAVPPLLAEHILAALVGIPVVTTPKGLAR
jgi:DNA (cytosine-5)-methyltransferase 1